MFDHEIETRLSRRKAFFDCGIKEIVRLAQVDDPHGRLQGYAVSVLDHPASTVCIGGSLMEKAVEGLTLVREELERNKEALEKAVNEMRVLSDMVQSCLAKEIQNIRDSRFALQRESGDALTALRDVRKFFLEGDYKEEMARLERFITMARELKTLVDDGTLSATADIMLKLSGPSGVRL